MSKSQSLRVQGIPNEVPESIAAVCRSRLLKAVNELLDQTNLENIKVIVGTASLRNNGNSGQTKNSYDLSSEERARKYKPRKPLFNFEQLVVPDPVREELLLAVDLIQFENKVFDEWGLRKIEPFPRTALNFHGLPGTGKTLAAHALASHIGSSILVASYAQIESMFHGEGPKNVEAIFWAAERDNALLFIDEADSLLSKRLTHVTQGSEQAINSMRSQLFICLEQFQGIVIFATNLVQNYDKAFETRVRHVYFPMPDEKCRWEIWRRHLPEQLPLATDFSLDRLAKIEDLCGRDIKNVVIDATMRVARRGKNLVELNDFLDAIDRLKAARIALASSSQELEPNEKTKVIEKLRKALPKEKRED